MKKLINLKEEFYALFQDHTYLHEWLTNDVLYGVWYCNLKDFSEFFINDSFKKSLKYPISLDQKPSEGLVKYLALDEKKKN